MRKLLLLLILILIRKIFVSTDRMRLLESVEEMKSINWEILYEAICIVESSKNPNAVNKITKATGVIQIMPIYVKEANRLIGMNLFTLKCRLSAGKSRAMFEIVQSYYNSERDIEKAALIHFLGNTGYKQNPQKGKQYWKKVEKEYKRLKEIK